jgi:hypothetical protein
MFWMTLIATITNIFLWYTTHKTLRHQRSSEHVQGLYDRNKEYRELFLSLLNNQNLLDIFARVNGFTEADLEAWIMERISSFIINNVTYNYLILKNDSMTKSSQWEGFKRDARKSFSYNSVRERWEAVGELHEKKFRMFVDQELLEL